VQKFLLPLAQGAEKENIDNTANWLHEAEAIKLFANTLFGDASRFF